MCDSTPTLADTPPTTRTVAYAPRDEHEISTAFGPGSINVGPGYDEVVVTMTSAAADELARLIAASKRLEPRADGQPPEADAGAWFGLVVDLIASAALCDPVKYSSPRVVRLEGVAR